MKTRPPVLWYNTGFDPERTEEVQVKVVKILYTLGFMFPAMPVLGFVGMPYPALLGLFAVAAPITVLSCGGIGAAWKKTERVASIGICIPM